MGGRGYKSPGAGISREGQQAWSSWQAPDYEPAHGRNQRPVTKNKKGKPQRPKAKGEGKNQSKQDAPQEQQTETEPTPSGETPKVEQETQPSTDEDMMRLCVPMIPSVGVLGVWLSTGGIAAYIEERIFLSCASSQKWTNIRAAPFLCALGGLTAF